MSLRTVFISVFLLCLQSAVAQRQWEQYLDMLADVEDVESAGWESAYETLCELEEHPMDVNTITREDLERLPFLDAMDVENICYYVYKYAPLKSLGELAMIEGMDYAKRQLLTFFLYIGESPEPGYPKFQNILKYGRQDLIATAKVPFYKRKGDENGYLGYPYRHNLRYNFHYGDYLKAGIVAAQDAGEPFFANRNKAGYDFYSYYFMMRKLGRIKSLVVGKYRADFGHGLILNNDFMLGKSAAITSFGRNASTFRVHSSTMSSDYLQGVATTISIIKDLDVSAFVSYRSIDATLNEEDGSVATIIDAGYHRTVSEMERKDNTKQFTTGVNLHYFNNGFHAGSSFLYTSLNRDLLPNKNTLYRRFYPSGDSFWNVSIDYGYTGARFSVSGETATGDCGAIATLNMLTWKLNDEFTLMALQRFYGKRYYSLYAQSFSEGGSVQNESGLYAGLSWRPSRKLSVGFYSDLAYFAWPKYQASFASRSWDHQFTINYSTDMWDVGGRYRLKMRQKDNDSKTGLLYKKEHRARFYVARHVEHGLHLKTQADVVYCDYMNSSFGWMVLQQGQFEFSKKLKTAMSLGYFRTDDFDSRVYSYERGMLYSFNFPVFYGKGYRITCLVRADFSENLMMQARLATTKYLDRSTIGSGYQLINHSSMTDVDVQLRWKF